MTPPSPEALEKFATVDLPKSIRAATAAQAVMTNQAEHIETLFSKPITLKNYPSALNETKIARGLASVYVEIAIIFASPIIIRVEIEVTESRPGEKFAARVHPGNADRRNRGSAAGHAGAFKAAPAQDRKPVTQSL